MPITLDLITTLEVTQALGCDRRTVRRMIGRGDLIPAMKIPGKTGAYLYDRAAVEALAQRRNAA